MQQSWRGIVSEVEKIIDRRMKRIEKQLDLLDSSFTTQVYLGNNNSFDTTAEEGTQYYPAPSISGPLLADVNSLPVQRGNTFGVSFYNRDGDDDATVTVYYIIDDAHSGTMTCYEKPLIPNSGVQAAWDDSGTANVVAAAANVLQSKTFTFSVTHDLLLVGVDYTKESGTTTTIDLVGIRYG